MEEANKRESINSSTRWRQILSEKDVGIFLYHIFYSPIFYFTTLYFSKTNHSILRD